MLRLLLLPLRAAVGAASVGVRAGYVAGRTVGPGRLLLVGGGIVAGLLLAPVPGRVLRARARRAMAARRPGPDELAERVTAALAAAQRTWHLPQPRVEVTGRRVVLRGEVLHETGRRDLATVAAAVPGVASVDNLVTVTGTGTGPPAVQRS